MVARAAVLVGGKGKRIGKEKFEVELCGKPMLVRALENLHGLEICLVCRDEEQKERVLELLRKWKADEKAEEVDIVIDEKKGFGALSGIHAVLKNFASCVITAVDMPFVNKRVVEHLFEVGERGWDAVIPKHRFPEPLLAYYSSKCVEKIEKAMENGERKIVDVFRKVNTLFYPAENLRKFDKHLVSFFNVNTVEDLRRAEEICKWRRV